MNSAVSGELSTIFSRVEMIPLGYLLWISTAKGRTDQPKILQANSCTATMRNIKVCDPFAEIRKVSFCAAIRKTHFRNIPHFKMCRHDGYFLLC